MSQNSSSSASLGAAGSQCWILCCQCGTSIVPNAANMCLGCIRQQVDISEGIAKQISIYYCRGCERYLQPPSHWISAALESRELMGLCLKRLKGLSGSGGCRLVDAGFLWTEPHSKRLKLKLTVQKEVLSGGTVLQASFAVEVVVLAQQCPECTRVNAKNTWKAVVQVRQKVSHQRTMLFLEQCILKHDAHRDASQIRTRTDGLDFFFQTRPHALKMVEFLASVAPVRSKSSEQLIATDVHSGASSYKFTYSVEVIPLCKDDLLCLPEKVAHAAAGMARLCLVSRVGHIVHLVDPQSGHVADLSSVAYWRAPFSALCTAHAELRPFIVLDVEACEHVPRGRGDGKYVLADVQVARMSDFGKNDTTFHVRSHLGRLLKHGDTVLGYDLASLNHNHEVYGDGLGAGADADIVLVKKSYAESRKRRGQRARPWRLKYLAKEEGGGGGDDDDMGDDAMSVCDDAVSAAAFLPDVAMRATKRRAPRRGRGKETAEQDLEAFMQDLEEDPELRANVHLYRVAGTDADMQPVSDTLSLPDIDLADLLDDLSLNGSDADTAHPT